MADGSAPGRDKRPVPCQEDEAVQTHIIAVAASRDLGATTEQERGGEGRQRQRDETGSHSFAELLSASTDMGCAQTAPDGERKAVRVRVVGTLTTGLAAIR